MKITRTVGVGCLASLLFQVPLAHSEPTALYQANRQPSKTAPLTTLKRPPFANSPVVKPAAVIPAVKNARIGFQFKQMGVLADGHFKQVFANIRFNPAELDKTVAQIRIPLQSIDSGNSEANAMLATPDWFSSTAYPHASWSLLSVKPLIGTKAKGEGLFSADGYLIIKGHQEPIQSAFVYQPATRQIKGDFVIDRLRYNIGDGEWRDTSIIDRDIRVSYQFTLP